MGEIIRIIEGLTGGKCFISDRYSLDHYDPPEYQDKEEEFQSDRMFETENNSGRNVDLNIGQISSSLFKYFLDGSRRTYKIGDFASRDNKFLPIVAGQIGTAVCVREHQKMRKYKVSKDNIMALPDRLGDEFESIKTKIQQVEKQGIRIGRIVRYRYQLSPDRPFENLAIAKIQKEMHDMELELLSEMVESKKLNTDKMLVIDGSLQFSGINSENIHIFKNVIGISKTFNPHLQGILKTKRKEIGFHLANLKYGNRTVVYSYDPKDRPGKYRKYKTRIGAWYMRIRDEKYLKNPLDGIIKIEKVPTTQREVEDGFDSDVIDEISKSILFERNVTCFGNDDRWANHLYPIYLTEYFLKNSFCSDKYFLNIF